MQRVGAAVDPDEHRLEVADVRPDDPQVALVAGPARDDQRVPVAEPRLQRREVDPLGQQAALVAQVLHRVLGELRQRFGHAAALLASAASSSRSSRACPRARQVPLRKTLAPRTVSGSPSETSSNSGAPGASIKRHAAAHEQQRARDSGSGPRLRLGDVDDDADAGARASSSAVTRSRSVWSTIATSSPSAEPRWTRRFVRCRAAPAPVNSTRVAHSLSGSTGTRGRPASARAPR